MRFLAIPCISACLIASLASAEPVTEARLLAAGNDVDNWLSYGRDYSEQRFTPLDQIDAGNVSELGMAWYFETDTHLGLQSTPLAIDGILYFSGAWNTVYAVDGASGEMLWSFDPEVPRSKSITACCGVLNRGLAAWDDLLYIGTLDGRLIAIDRATGTLRWSAQTTDPNQAYSITGAPRVARGKVFIGNGGSEFGTRGFVSAYDAASGELAWRFYTVPGNPADGFENAAMERAAETWNGEWWKYGGGGTVWDSIVYDPEFNQLYLGVGNGAPHNRRIRSPGGGDNLYLTSIVALNPDTGEYLWHYQQVPGDNWDYTASQQMTLAEIPWEGQQRKVILHAPKAGFVYIVDRETGKLLSAEPYTTVTWASGYDLDTGRPRENPGQDYDGEPAMVFPSAMGGHNWHPMAYSPDTGLLYIPELDMGMEFNEIDAVDYKHLRRHYNTGYELSGEAYSQEFTQAMLTHLPKASLLAWDPVRQQAAWKLPHPYTHNGGVLATGGNLVFQGTSDGRFIAVRADNGELLWTFPMETSVMAGPISYRVNGEQYIAVTAGRGGALMINMGKTYPTGNPNNRLVAFKLGASGALPVTPTVERPSPPPMPEASEDQIAEGRNLFNRFCARCHGADVVGDGSIPDLRYLAPVWHENFAAVVREGLMEQAGMPRFDDVLNAAQVDNVHAYVISRAHEDYALRTEQGWLARARNYLTDKAAQLAAWLVRRDATTD